VQGHHADIGEARVPGKESRGVPADAVVGAQRIAVPDDQHRGRIGRAQRHGAPAVTP